MRKAQAVFEKAKNRGRRIIIAADQNMCFNGIMLENYLKDERCLTACGGLIVDCNPFVHLREGRLSTARGMTLEYAEDLLKLLANK